LTTSAFIGGIPTVGAVAASYFFASRAPPHQFGDLTKRKRIDALAQREDIWPSTQLRTNKQNARRLANNHGLSEGMLTVSIRRNAV
jgi:hypothetical protein